MTAIHAEKTAFARLENRQSVHIVSDAETLCGGDLVDGHQKFRAERWYRYESPEEFPDDAHLCKLCDQAYSEGTTLDSTEIANEVRRLLGLGERHSGHLRKEEKMEVIQALQQCETPQEDSET